MLVRTRSRRLARVRLSARTKILRAVWQTAYWLLYRFTPVPLHGWRRMVLRCFGAKVGSGAHPYPSATVWAPWNLVMEPGSCLSRGVDCYSVATVTVGEHATVSQYAYLCAASHDHNDPDFPLTAGPITIGARAWVAAGAFVGPGVTVGEGAVVGAMAVVTRDVEPWNVVVGNPARFIKMRERNYTL